MGKRRCIFLYPLSIIWRLITDFRNHLYNSGILKSYKFNVPVICIGNITVGGTGKTPHSEYLIDLLKDNFKVTLLSRGYRRHTRGFQIAGPESNYRDIGDEPFQISRKFPGITVAVDRNRVNGIEKILETKPETDVIILDDGYQHRRITPGLSILLSDFGRLMFRDHLLPYGNLRESIRNINRADIILITKTPTALSEEDQKLIEAETGKLPRQKLFFTTFRYKEPVPVFAKADRNSQISVNHETGIVLVTGVADPEPLFDHLQTRYKEIIQMPFGDHHDYKEKDIENIRIAWHSLRSNRKYVFTTEKDAVRLREFIYIAEPLMSSFYYIPIEIEFLGNKKEEFDNMIIDYARKNKRNS